MRALSLKQEGWSQKAIAEALGVSKPAVSQWLAMAHRDGPNALRSHPASGRLSRLTAEQKALIPEFLWHGPESYGFRGHVWTCARIARVIEEEFGVRYHKDHVSRLLRELHWRPQVPIRRAIQRDKEAIQRWRDRVWPALRRQARRERRVLVFEDESGFYLLPGVVRTYAPEAQTPVLREKQTRDHLSVLGGMTPEGKVYTLARQESLNGLHSVAFLQHLLRVAGERLLVIWDGSPIHRRDAVRAFVEQSKGKVRVEALPGYAPDLNPWDEGGWHHLKSDMPIHVLEIHPLAQRELKKAERWYRRQGARRVQRFLQAVDDVIQRIATGAEQGVPCLQRFRWMQVKRFPYLLYYEIRGPLPVLIYANAHARRRLGYWLLHARP